MDLEFHEWVWIATSLGISFLIGLVAFIVMMDDEESDAEGSEEGDVE